jgi:uncharacterized protein involved in exopolysaccharide biosynthesis
MDLKELITYWKVIKKRLWLIVLLIGVTLGVIVIVSYLAKPHYQASTSFQVTAPVPADVSLFSEFRLSTARDELRYTRGNFLEVLQSEFVIKQVINELQLNVAPDQLRAEQILIEPFENSDFVRLTVTADSPKMATAIANTLMVKASQYFGALSARSFTANRESIQQQLQKTKDELDRAKAALVQFKIKNKLGSLGGLLDKQQSLIVDLKLSRDNALAKGDQASVLAYEQIIASRERELQDLILLTLEHDTLQQNFQSIDATYSSLVNKETEAKLKENELLSARFIRIIPASEPTRPLPQVSTILITVAAIISLVLGVLIAFLLEALNNLSVSAGKDDNAYSPESVRSASAASVK